MSGPDLADPEERRAYQAELLRVRRGWRWTGLTIVAVAAICMIARAKYDQPWSGPLGLATIAGLVIGWGMVIFVIVSRTRYHRRRMAE